ncbi:MAG: hypothetical protein MZW92_65860 [Comamonadaceae bacterium]|nr:hypothetical protein [Comamonadaceae bacterium]
MPQGALRALAGLEALNGLLLIGWTASYTYIAMRHFWPTAPCTPGESEAR